MTAIRAPRMTTSVRFAKQPTIHKNYVLRPLLWHRPGLVRRFRSEPDLFFPDFHLGDLVNSRIVILGVEAHIRHFLFTRSEHGRKKSTVLPTSSCVFWMVTVRTCDKEVYYPIALFYHRVTVEPRGEIGEHVYLLHFPHASMWRQIP